MKKRLIIVLALCLVFSMLLGSVAFADTRASSYLNAYYADVIHQGGGIVSVDFGVYATHTMTKLGISKIVVYKTSGVVAKTITNSTSGYSSLQTSNASVYFHSVNVQLTSGTSYYMVITFYAKDSSGAGAANYTTGTFTA